MELQIRTAQASDKGPVAELMYSSGTHIYDYLYGARAVEFLRHEFTSGRGFAGHPFVTVAVLDEIVVATGCFYDRDSYGERTQGSVKNMLHHFGVLRSVPIMARARHLSSVMRRPKPGELYLSNFGVSPALRSQGIGSKLIAHKLSEARSVGYQAVWPGRVCRESTWGSPVSAPGAGGDEAKALFGPPCRGARRAQDGACAVARHRERGCRG